MPGLVVWHHVLIVHHVQHGERVLKTLEGVIRAEKLDCRVKIALTAEGVEVSVSDAEDQVAGPLHVRQAVDSVVETVVILAEVNYLQKKKKEKKEKRKATYTKQHLTS
jgi:hypothetical protein